MKRIRIPAPVSLTLDNGEPAVDGTGKPLPPQTFSEFIRFRTRDPRFSEHGELTLDDIEAGLALRARVDAAIQAGNEFVEIDDAHHIALVRVVDHPTSGWNAIVAEQLISFIRAVKCPLKTEDTGPEKRKK